MHCSIRGMSRSRIEFFAVRWRDFAVWMGIENVVKLKRECQPQVLSTARQGQYAFLHPA